MTAPRWDMDVLFEGGVHGPTFAAALDRAETEAEELVKRADELPEPPDALDGRVRLMLDLFEAYEATRAIRVCAGGQSSANTEDRKAQRASARIYANLGRLRRAEAGRLGRGRGRIKGRRKPRARSRLEGLIGGLSDAR